MTLSPQPGVIGIVTPDEELHFYVCLKKKIKEAAIICAIRGLYDNLLKFIKNICANCSVSATK